MATVNLTATQDRDGFVIYFGGELNEVDTYTFANALVSISDAFREINTQVNHGYSLELRLEALAEGSFKARIREFPTSIKEALKFARNNVVLPIFVTYIYTHLIDPDKTRIIVNDNEVIIQHGHDRTIVPRSAYNIAQSLPNKDRVSSHVARALEVVQRDENISSLGLALDMKKDSAPALLIARDDFTAVLAAAGTIEGHSRILHEVATIAILKPVIAKSDRRWEFVWNGVKISASIRDQVFLIDLVNRKYLIGSGDALIVDLAIYQRWNDGAGVWLNDSYRVEHVREYVPGARQTRLFEPPH